MTWAEDVREALFFLGGESPLSKIYEEVKIIRSRKHSHLGEYEAWVRNALQQNSRGKGKDMFVHISRGIWGLK